MTYSDEVLADTPRAYYKTSVDSTSQPDASGNGLDATSTHNAFIEAGPKGGGALGYLSDSSQNLNVGNLGGWRTGPFRTGSIEFWLRTTDDRAGRYFMGNTGGFPRVQFESRAPSTNTIDWQLSDDLDNRMRWRWSPANLWDGQWHHVCVSWENGATAFTCVIDGVEFTGTVSTLNSDTLQEGVDIANDITVGQRDDGSGMDIDIAKPAFYDHMVTVARFQAHFNADDDTEGISNPESEHPLNMGTAVAVASSDTILAKPQLVTWHHDGAWWLLSYHNAWEGWYVWKWDEVEGEWVRSSGEVHADPLSRFDVYFDGTVAWAAQTSDGNNRLFELTYSTGEWTATLLDTRTDGAWGGSGSQSMNVSLVKDTQGRLWWTRFQEGSLYTRTWDIGTSAWLATEQQVVSGLNNGDLHQAVAWDGKVGMFYSAEGASEMRFVHRNDADAIGTWQTVEVVDSLTNGADDHPTIVADGADLYAAWKTTIVQTETGEPNLRAAKRTTAGWSTPVNVVVHNGVEWTRPGLAVDGDTVYVTATAVGDGDMRTFTSPKGTLSFTVDSTDVTQDWRDPRHPRFPVSAGTGRLLVAAQDRAFIHGFLFAAAGDDPDPANLAVVIDGATAQLSWDASPMLT